MVGSLPLETGRASARERPEEEEVVAMVVDVVIVELVEPADLGMHDLLLPTTTVASSFTSTRRTGLMTRRCLTRACW